ncbi:hypothetical protein SANA_07780 [Gottschalkiaceae bacterium SANA]|nr:hypothetical protein SANA_07780 [Gottschalkiaceae bacterium SANA]
MKKNRMIILALMLALLFSGIGFAMGLPPDQPLGDKERHLFYASELPSNKLSDIQSFMYVADLNQIQILQGTDEDESVVGYDLTGEQSFNIATVKYPVMVTNSAILTAQSKINSDLIYLTRNGMLSDQGDSGDRERMRTFDLRLMRLNDSEEILMDVPVYSGRFGEIRGLYTTKDYIVVLYIDEHMTGIIERYTYAGVMHDHVMVNYRTKGIVEGPDGSTLYMQKANPTRGEGEDECEDPIEVVQIIWDEKVDVAGPKRVIQEQTRVGHTLARFTDSQFGLLRMEDAETGIVDYKAPIRSKENLVKLQIPYCDIKAKLESGARNLMVEYQDQTLSFPMDLFNCDDMLAAMPCQDHATIEIIMHMDEAGTVTYEMQLFVVEKVDGMTKVVHRKTIQ